MKNMVFTFFTLLILPVSVLAAGAGVEIPDKDWSFESYNATWDKDQLLRGYTVATQLCMSCHSFKYISHRDLLVKAGFSEADAMQLAADRDMKLDDKFMSLMTDEDAKGIYGKALPDLSVMNKARHGGADYTYALLTGYSEDPAEIAHNMPDGVPVGAYYNSYFPGHAIAMPPPLTGPDMVTYHDGTEASVSQMAKDVAYFMQWTAEPERTVRQRMGVYVLIYLAIFIVLTYLLKRKIWKRIKH